MHKTYLLFALFLTGALRFSGAWGAQLHLQAGLAVGLFLLSLLLVKEKKLNTGSLWIAAIFSRLLWLGFPVGDDIWRYLWEGRLFLEGLNPYALSPNAPELLPLRDALWQSINHKDLPTIYGPLALFSFSFSALAYPSPFLWQGLLIASDLGSIYLLYRIANRQKLPPQNLYLYIFNPLILIFLNGEAHLESLVNFCLLLSLSFALKKQWTRFWIFFAFAPLIKINTLIFLPIFINKESLKKAPWFFLPWLSYLPFLEAGVFDTFLKFGTGFYFNSPLHFYFKQSGLFEVGLIFWAFCGLFATGLYLLVQPNLIKNFAALSLFWGILLPTIHPWYLSLPIAFSTLRPRLSFFVLQITLTLGLIPLYAEFVSTGIWQEDDWSLNFIWLPPLGIWLFERWKKTRPFLPQRQYPEVRTVSVIVPIYNEGENIVSLWNTLKSETKGLDAEIFIVDAGSTDNTRKLAKEEKIPLLHSPKKGRGHQIYSALQQCQGDVIAILHADVKPEPGVFKGILHFLNQNSNILGGSCTMHFAQKVQGLPLIQGLNSFRSRVLGIAFGDQLQFFRRTPEMQKHGIPNLPLMEDIALSLQLKLYGESAHFDHKVQASTRRWEKTNRLKNAFLIIHISFIYLLLKRLKHTPKDPYFYYQFYYGKKH